MESFTERQQRKQTLGRNMLSRKPKLLSQKTFYDPSELKDIIPNGYILISKLRKTS